MRVQDEYGKFEWVKAIDSHDVAVNLGMWPDGMSLRQFYLLPAHKGIKVKAATRRIHKKPSHEGKRSFQKEKKTEKKEPKKEEKEQPAKAFRMIKTKPQGPKHETRQT